MNEADQADEALAWKPPFVARDAEDGLECPACGAESSVCVREHETYLDANDYEAFCEECHAMLTVWAAVDIAFHEAEVAQ